MRALGSEIAKNLVLAGIGALTVQDDQDTSETDLGAHCLFTETHIGHKVVQSPSP